MAERIKATDIRKIIEDALKKLYGEDVKELRITFCVMDEQKGIWKVNAIYKPPQEDRDRTALFAIDLKTGEVKEFREGWSWRL